MRVTKEGYIMLTFGSFWLGLPTAEGQPPQTYQIRDLRRVPSWIPKPSVKAIGRS